MTVELSSTTILERGGSQDSTTMYRQTLELALKKIPDFCGLVELEVEASGLPSGTRNQLEELFPGSVLKKGPGKEVQIQLSRVKISGLDSITADLRVGKDVATIQLNESGVVRLLPFDMIPPKKRYYGLMVKILGIEALYAELDRDRFADCFLGILQQVLITNTQITPGHKRT